jgi:hypothetical protein
MLDKFVGVQTYNDGYIYILPSNICTIQQHKIADEDYTSIEMNSGNRHTIKGDLLKMMEILAGL